MIGGRGALRVILVGIPGAGVRTLLSALCDGHESSERGQRTWDGTAVEFTASRPDSVHLDSADLIVVVISARQGLPADLSHVWMSAAEHGIPALVAVTHIDEPTVDMEEIAAMCTRVLTDGGEIFLPWLPILDDDERVCGFINLLSEEIVEWSQGGPVVHASEQRHQELIEEARAELCESVMLAVDDDSLFASYMSGTPIDGEVIETHMHEQTRRGLRHPVLGTGLVPHLLGVGLLLDTIGRGRSSGLAPRLSDQRSGLLQQLGHRLRSADHGKEVRIASPAGHDMLMQMRGNPGTGERALVHADVESVRARHLPKGLHAALGEFRELTSLLGSEVRVVRDVAVGADEHVPGVVRVEIHDREYPCTAGDD